MLAFWFLIVVLLAGAIVRMAEFTPWERKSAPFVMIGLFVEFWIVLAHIRA